MANMYNGLFRLDDIQVTGGFLGNMRGGTASAAFTRGRRGLRGGAHDKGKRFITYEISARGSYRPPPHRQLGTGIEDSINRDPGALKRSLEERAGSDGEGGLPPVFAEVESTGARHLTVKVESRPKSVVERSTGSFESWATVPLVLLVAAIASLSLAFVGRRVLVRRVVKRKDRFGAYLEKGAGFEYNDEDVKKANYRSGGDDTWDGSSGSDDADREWGRRETVDTRSTAADSSPGDERRKKRRRKKKSRTVD